MIKLLSSILIILLILTLSACSPRRPVWDGEIGAFNKELKAEFEEIRRVSNYVVRPMFHWDVRLKKTADDGVMDDILDYMAEYIRSGDLYTERLEKKFTGIFSVWGISITFYRSGEMLRTCDGYYKHRVTGPEDAVNQNEIDDFATWYITENRETHVYVYDPEGTQGDGSPVLYNTGEPSPCVPIRLRGACR